MSETFQLSLVSPEKVFFEAPVTMVTMPGREGEFGVLAGHAPLITSLRPGVITIEADGEAPKRFFAAGGFVDVTPARTTVLADHAEPVEKLDATKIEHALRDLKEDLTDAKTDAERAAIEAGIAIEEAKLQALAA